MTIQQSENRNAQRIYRQSAVDSHFCAETFSAELSTNPPRVHAFRLRHRRVGQYPAHEKLKESSAMFLPGSTRAPTVDQRQATD